jgi:glycosyltransferase involved in cell wall biosynthesis
MPGVSIVVPARNAGRTITAAIESVFAQTYRDFEVIVVDDGSSDDTAKRVAEWGDQIVYVYQANGGVACARREGIARARGRLVAFLDADDVWMPRKLERQVAYFAQFPTTGFVHSSALVTATPTATLRETVDSSPLDCEADPPVNVLCDLFHGVVDIDTATVMARRDVLDTVGGFDPHREMDADAWTLWLRIAARYPVGYMSVPLSVHRLRISPRRTLESYRLQERIIETTAPLCAIACARHAANPARCTQHRRHQLYGDIGRLQFWSGRMTAARVACREAIRLWPTNIRLYGYYAASFLWRRLLDPLLRLRRVLADTALPRQPAAPAASMSLLHDTAYRRTRRALVHAIHTADDVVSRIGRSYARVLFEAASPLSLAVFGPVLERLERDERIQIWFMTADDSWDADRIFRAVGITNHIVSAAAVRRMKFDAYVNTDFWNMTWLPRRTRRVHMFHGVAGKYGLDAPTHIAPTIASFDRLLFANRDRLQRYARAGLIDPDGPQAALVGYPKVDCLVDGSLDRESIQRSLGLDPTVPTVLYAPTWSPYSSLHSMGADVIRALAGLDINVVVKLHDRSYDRDVRGSGGINWSARLNRICDQSHVHIAQDADASQYLFVADLLVTDHSSMGFEYMLLDRPIVVIDCPQLIDKAHVNRDKVRQLRSAAAVAFDAASMVEAVRRELSEPMRLSSVRRAIADELFYCPGGATTRAVQCIYDLLSLPAPTVRHATSGSTTRAAFGIPSLFTHNETRTAYRAF